MSLQIYVRHLVVGIEVDIGPLQRVVCVRSSIHVVNSVVVGFHVRLQHMPRLAISRENVGT